MIKQILLRNYLLAKELCVSFSDGLQVITGETGAGKSVLIGAIQTVFGASAHSSMLRDPSKSAYLEITFEVNQSHHKLKQLLNKFDVEAVENEIFFIREILPNSRSKSFINGRRVTIPIMQDFFSALIDYHNQRDHLVLLDTQFQLELIDRFGKLEPIRNDFQEYYARLQENLEKFHKLQAIEQENEEKLQLYRFQIEEIENANLQESEDEELEKELQLLDHADEIITLSKDIEHQIIERENSAYDQINSYLTQLTKFSENEKRIQESVEHFYESLQHLDDGIALLREVYQSIDLDEERYEFIQQRLHFLNQLMQKYKKSIQGIITYEEEIKDKVKHFSSVTTEIEKFREKIESEKKIVYQKAEILSQQRKKAATKMINEIQENLKKMAIPHAQVEIQFDKFIEQENFYRSLSGLKKTGNDTVEIYFSANPGMPMQTLRKAASGGELSRFLLTVKKMISDKVDPKVVIFDEIDAGIGGKTAEYVGEFIHEIARCQQVICITHLAQIASFARSHFAIDKISSQRETEISVQRLEKEEKRQEIARMIAGDKTKNALNYADELIKTRKNKENNTK